MKKTKCSKTFWISGCLIFGITGITQFLGLPLWVKFKGWQEADISLGIVFLGTAIGIYLLYKYLCNAAHVVKCIECGKVYSETETQYGNCPNCGGKLVDIKHYYDKSNKSEEPIKNPQADS